MLERAEAELESSRDVIGGPLSIAGFATSVRGLAPQALVDLRTRYPQLQPRLRELEPADAVPLLVRRDLDLVIAQDWANAPLALPEGLGKAAIVDDVADIALPASHRLARQTSVALDDLVAEPWITWLEGSICHDWLMHMLRRRGHEPRVAHTASEYATQLALVGAGLGAAVIPRLGRGHVPKGVKIVRVRAHAAPARVRALAARRVAPRRDSRGDRGVSARRYGLTTYLSHVPTSAACGPFGGGVAGRVGHEALAIGFGDRARLLADPVHHLQGEVGRGPGRPAGGR